MSRIFRNKKRALLGVVAAVVAVSAAFAYWTTGGSGDGSGDVADNATGTIALKGTIDRADFRPGVTSPVTVTAENTDVATDLRVQSTTISNVDVTGDGTANGGCDPDWFSGYGTPVDQDQTIEADDADNDGVHDAGEGKETLGQPHTITFDNADANQDDCKGATVTFDITSD